MGGNSIECENMNNFSGTIWQTTNNNNHTLFAIYFIYIFVEAKCFYVNVAKWIFHARNKLTILLLCSSFLIHNNCFKILSIFYCFLFAVLRCEGTVLKCHIELCDQIITKFGGFYVIIEKHSYLVCVFLLFFSLLEELKEENHLLQWREKMNFKLT